MLNIPLVYWIKKKWLKLAAELIEGGFYDEDKTDRGNDSNDWLVDSIISNYFNLF